jgi:hypothetical protein
MSTFSMTEVCHAVMRDGITAYIEHTGSGVMTLYAGSRVDDVWTVAAGPGRYTDIKGEMDMADMVDAFAAQLRRSQAGITREAVGNTEAFFVGPGNMTKWGADADHARISVWTCPELATVAEIADEIIHQVREHEAQTPAVTPEVKTWPDTPEERLAFVGWQYEVENGDTLRGFRDWLAAKQEQEREQWPTN